MVAGPSIGDAHISDGRSAHMSTIEYDGINFKTGTQTGPWHRAVGATVEAYLCSGQLMPHVSHQVP